MRKETFGVGSLNTEKSVESAVASARGWLKVIGLDPYEVKTDFDPRINMAIVRFNYQGKDYEFRSTKQKDCRLNMHAIARAMEYKVRLHKLGIEDFGVAMSPYLQIGYSGPRPEAPQARVSQDPNAYLTLGVSTLASNDQIRDAYKSSVKAWHPDRFYTDSEKKAASERIAKINEAWDIIKKERGLG